MNEKIFFTINKVGFIVNTYHGKAYGYNKIVFVKDKLPYLYKYLPLYLLFRLPVISYYNPGKFVFRTKSSFSYKNRV